MRLQPIRHLVLILIVNAGAIAADEPGRNSGSAGEYRGIVKRTEMTLWSALLTGPGGERGLAVMFFPSVERQAQTDRLRDLTAALIAAGRNRCKLEEVFEQVYRPGDGVRAGLVLVQGAWEQQTALKMRRYPEGYWMTNDEYPFLRGREYMVKEIRLDSGTGKLASLQLTQTGFIQNFFDNPRLRLTRNETGAAGAELLAEYVKAKFTARNALHAFFESVQQDSVPPCP